MCAAAFVCALAGFCLAALAGALEWRRVAVAAGGAGLAGCLLGLVVVSLSTGRIAFYGPFETLMVVGLWLGLLAMWDALGGRLAVAAWSWGLGAAFLLWLFAAPLKASPITLIPGYVWMPMFFELRLAAQALLLYAAACHLAAWRGGGQGAPLRGRLALLGGWGAFMAGELVGAWWSYGWLGDFWQWNAGFLSSTALLLLMGLGLHLPPRWAARPWLRLIVGAAPGVALNLVVLNHQINNKKINK
ncbi:hypothetical protein FAK_12300 [Desulfoferula mesophila]|uniref:DUF2157 domain-containing protein n=1 Tax=Desulfoferula mesophila TaxID=3058419 RepID=A0AAU9EHX0_9BACT|nr:hypothetical protein FAK_12300 [Desulfoferula mesophilus]